jgi:hypothetical protein
MWYQAKELRKIEPSLGKDRTTVMINKFSGRNAACSVAL